MWGKVHIAECPFILSLTEAAGYRKKYGMRPVSRDLYSRPHLSPISCVS